jgi:hypothetical protein
MASRNYILPVDSLSLSQQADYRLKAIAAAIERATVKGIGSIGDDEIPGYNAMGTSKQRVGAILGFLSSGNMPRALDVRDFQNILDAGTALDQWNTAALAVVGTNYSVFQAVAAPTLGNNKLAVFYNISIETIPLPISRVTFRSGGATGNTVAVFDLEQLAEQERLQGYFTEPVVIDPTITFAIQTLCRIATGAAARVQLGSFVVEPAGQTIA